MLFCPTLSTRLSSDLVPALTCAMEAVEYDWCTLVLSKLLSSVRSFARRFYSYGHAGGCGGCILFVVIFYLDRLDREAVQWGVFPRLKVWTMKEIMIASKETDHPMEVIMDAKGPWMLLMVRFIQGRLELRMDLVLFLPTRALSLLRKMILGIMRASNYFMMGDWPLILSSAFLQVVSFDGLSDYNTVILPSLSTFIGNPRCSVLLVVSEMLNIQQVYHDIFVSCMKKASLLPSCQGTCCWYKGVVRKTTAKRPLTYLSPLVYANLGNSINILY